MATNGTPILDIPCTFREPRTRRAIARVLRQIKERFPKDFARLLTRVVEIRRLTKRDCTRHCAAGAWKPERGRTIGRYREVEPGAFVLQYRKSPMTRGRVLIPQIDERIGELGAITDHALTALLAHELGHACATRKDKRERRAPASRLTDDWAAEAVADMYAIKWGFERQIRLQAKKLGRPLPGSVLADSDMQRYFLNADFVFVKLERARQRTSSKKMSKFGNELVACKDRVDSVGLARRRSACTDSRRAAAATAVSPGHSAARRVTAPAR
jgi:hypothetical protein